MAKPIIKFIKTHPDAVLPTKAHADDTGYDITAVEDVMISAGGCAVVPIGLQVAFIEPGYWFKIEGRSGLGFKHSIFPHYGIIDENFRGNLDVKLYNYNRAINYHIKKGDRIAQLVIHSRINAYIEWAEKVTETDRGENGFGSSGK